MCIRIYSVLFGNVRMEIDFGLLYASACVRGKRRHVYIAMTASIIAVYARATCKAQPSQWLRFQIHLDVHISQ